MVGGSQPPPTGRVTAPDAAQPLADAARPQTDTAAASAAGPRSPQADGGSSSNGKADRALAGSLPPPTKNTDGSKADLAAGADDPAAAKPHHTPRATPTTGWKDVAYHSTAAMLGAGVIGLPYVFACLGWAGGVILLSLAILVSRDTYMCLVRCYEVPGDLFFERRWRHRRAQAAARARRAALAQKLACGGDKSGPVVAFDGDDPKKALAIARAASGVSGPGGALDFERVGEDEHDTDAVERVRDAVLLYDAETGEPMDMAAAEREFCARKAVAMRRRKAGATALGADGTAAALANDEDDVFAVDDALEAGAKPPRKSLALFHEYSALSRWAFGRRLGSLLLTPFQTALIIGINLSYQVVGSEALFSIVASSRALALTAKGLPTDSAADMPKAPFYLGYAAVQALFAVACNSLGESGVISLAGVVASVVYCGIASALSLAIVAWRKANPSAVQLSYEPRDALFSPNHPATGPSAPGGANLGAAFAVLNAISMFLFTLGGHNVSLETQYESLGIPPPTTIPAMRKGVEISFLITALACFCTGLTGYAAFGATVGDNILTTISKAALNPLSLSGNTGSGSASSISAASLVGVRVAIIIAQFAIFGHVLAAYNVYAQVLWAGIERRIGDRWPRLRHGAGASCLKGAAMRAPMRLVYVAAVMAVALAVPFFGAIAGIVGAFCITPTTFVLPYALEIIRHREFDPDDEGLEGKTRSTLSRRRRAACWIGGLGASAVGLAGTAASVYVIIAQLQAQSSVSVRH
jgi:amino acid permease